MQQLSKLRKTLLQFNFKETMPNTFVKQHATIIMAEDESYLNLKDPDNIEKPVRGRFKNDHVAMVIAEQHLYI